MIDHSQHHNLLVYFGNQNEQIFLDDVKRHQYSWSLQTLIQDFGLQNLVVLDQIHSNVGLLIEQSDIIKSGWFDYQGDFLITQQKNLALITLTADCVPLVLYDMQNQAVALVHAGWKGSYAGIVQQVIDAMSQRYNSRLDHLQVWFGPSARWCCYKVSSEFRDDFIKKYPYSVGVFVKKNNDWYFDNNLFLQDTLKKIGIRDHNVYTNNALCTICNAEFCSFRRQKEEANRQVTLVALR